MALSDKQLEILFRPINPKRVKNLRGFSYVEEWDVEAHLTRIFGFLGWDKEISYGMIFDEEVAKGRWTVAYHAHCRLTVRDAEGLESAIKEDAASGTATNQPDHAAAHDLAIKDAVSSAVKRAAKALGNQFGLSLYDDGSQRSVVGTSLAYPPVEHEEEPVTDPETVREKAAEIRDRMIGDRETPEAD